MTVNANENDDFKNPLELDEEIIQILMEAGGIDLTRKNSSSKTVAEIIDSNKSSQCIAALEKFKNNCSNINESFI